jgi:phenylpropionate dioxygenase-like ring-hydroxylating dioxygenase large terminal subunit
VPLSVDTLVENLVDPSHVAFSHHGVIVSAPGPGRGGMIGGGGGRRAVGPTRPARQPPTPAARAAAPRSACTPTRPRPPASPPTPPKKGDRNADARTTGELLGDVTCHGGFSYMYRTPVREFEVKFAPPAMSR